jgi:hypothetical protein
MPSKEPAPEVGTCEQPSPNVCEPASEDIESVELLDLAEESDPVELSSSLPQAARVTDRASPATATVAPRRRWWSFMVRGLSIG